MAKVFSLQQILSTFSSSAIHIRLIKEIEKGFIDYSNGSVYVAQVVHLGSTDSHSSIPQMLGKGDVCVKSGYIVNGHDKYYVVKIAGGGFSDQHQQYPNSGAMLVFSQITGALNGILLDDGILTELRTAAAGALAASYFTPSKLTTIGIVGTGIQARFQLEMLQHIFPLKNGKISVLVHGRNPEKSRKYKDEMNSKHKGIKVDLARDLNEIGKCCQLIVMCTSARSPVLMQQHLMERDQSMGLHINCIGADSVGKQELEEGIVSKITDLVLVDSKRQCYEFGEIQHAVKHKTLNDCKVREFGKVLGGDLLCKIQITW